MCRFDNPVLQVRKVKLNNFKYLGQVSNTEWWSNSKYDLYLLDTMNYYLEVVHNFNITLQHSWDNIQKVDMQEIFPNSFRGQYYPDSNSRQKHHKKTTHQYHLWIYMKKMINKILTTQIQ